MPDDEPLEPNREENAPKEALRGPEAGGLPASGDPQWRSSARGNHWVPPTPEELARLLPQYCIERILGHGGMGAVYKGMQPELERPVAIKVLAAELSADEQFVHRFKREARTLARLHHPGIVAVYDCGQTTEGHLYFVMEFVDGTDLRHFLPKAGLNADQAMEVVSQICDALQAAHEQGFIHRDIKPANILLTSDGFIKIADFGLARPAQEIDTGALTMPSMVMGTPDYMSPEQRSGYSDHRTDIFALGVVLYEMLTGRPPRGAFAAPSRKVLVDVRIDEVVLKAMQEEPELRYQQASEMKTAVDQIRTSKVKKGAPAPRSMVLPSTRRSMGPGLAVLILLLLAGACFFVWYQYGKQAAAYLQTATRTEAVPTATPSPTAAAVSSATPVENAEQQTAAVSQATPKVETPTPATLPSATPKAAPAPSVDPMAWALENRKYWPPQVQLTRPFSFPIMANNVQLGTMVVPAGTFIKLVSLRPGQVTAEWSGNQTVVPIDGTDVMNRLSAEMARAEIAAAASTPRHSPSPIASAPQNTASGTGANAPGAVPSPSAAQPAVTGAASAAPTPVLSSLKPIFEYTFNETGTSAASTGSNPVALTFFNASGVAADLHSADSQGVSGLPGDRAFDNTASTGMGRGYVGGAADIPPNIFGTLSSFTFQCWYKASSGDKLNAARILIGDGFSSYFDGQLTIHGTEVGPHATDYGETGHWIFYAVTYDGTKPQNNVGFYFATKFRPVVRMGDYENLDAGQISDSIALIVGNSGGNDRPFKGYIDDIRFFGNSNDGSGALDVTRLEALRQADIANTH